MTDYWPALLNACFEDFSAKASVDIPGDMHNPKFMCVHPAWKAWGRQPASLDHCPISGELNFYACFNSGEFSCLNSK